MVLSELAVSSCICVSSIKSCNCYDKSYWESQFKGDGINASETLTTLDIQDYNCRSTNKENINDTTLLIDSNDNNTKEDNKDNGIDILLSKIKEGKLDTVSNGIILNNEEQELGETFGGTSPIKQAIDYKKKVYRRLWSDYGVPLRASHPILQQRELKRIKDPYSFTDDKKTTPGGQIYIAGLLVFFTLLHYQ